MKWVASGVIPSQGRSFRKDSLASGCSGLTGTLGAVSMGAQVPRVSSSTKGVLCLMFVLFFCVCRPFSRGRTLLLTSYSCENTRLFFMPSQGRVPLIHVHCRVSLPNSLFLYAAPILTPGPPDRGPWAPMEVSEPSQATGGSLVREEGRW